MVVRLADGLPLSPDLSVVGFKRGRLKQRLDEPDVPSMLLSLKELYTGFQVRIARGRLASRQPTAITGFKCYRFQAGTLETKGELVVPSMLLSLKEHYSGGLKTRRYTASKLEKLRRSGMGGTW